MYTYYLKELADNEYRVAAVKSAYQSIFLGDVVDWDIVTSFAKFAKVVIIPRDPAHNGLSDPEPIMRYAKGFHGPTIGDKADYVDLSRVPFSYTWTYKSPPTSSGDLGEPGIGPLPPQAPIVAKETQIPRCIIHDEEMILQFYDRPGSPPGNGWVCKSCRDIRAEYPPAMPPSGTMLNPADAPAAPVQKVDEWPEENVIDWSQCCVCRPTDKKGHYCEIHSIQAWADESSKTPKPLSESKTLWGRIARFFARDDWYT
jgi:hypothetical protein